MKSEKLFRFRVALNLVDCCYRGIPIGLFWAGVALVMFSPETISNVLITLRHATPGDIRHEVVLAGKMLGVVMVIWVVFHWVFGLSDFGRSLADGDRVRIRFAAFTAAHEAGHAMVYAALGELPDDLEIVLNDAPDSSGAGFVGHTVDVRKLEEKTVAEWEMMVFLAGKLGESALNGESTLGGAIDHQRWIVGAKRYLANHYAGIFYADPQNKFEQAQNDAKLEALQDAQLALLREMFSKNEDVFKELVNSLLVKRKLNKEEISAFLCRVQLPDGFPKPASV